MSAGAGATGRSLGGAALCLLDPWLTEALSRGGAWAHWDPSSQEAWWRWGLSLETAGLQGLSRLGETVAWGQRACHTSPSRGCWAGVCSHHRPRKLGWPGPGKGSAVVAPPFMCHSTVVPWSHCGQDPATNTPGHPQLLSPPWIHSPNPLHGTQPSFPPWDTQTGVRRVTNLRPARPGSTPSCPHPDTGCCIPSHPARGPPTLLAFLLTPLLWARFPECELFLSPASPGVPVLSSLHRSPCPSHPTWEGGAKQKRKKIFQAWKKDCAGTPSHIPLGVKALWCPASLHKNFSRHFWHTVREYVSCVFSYSAIFHNLFLTLKISYRN